MIKEVEENDVAASDDSDNEENGEIFISRILAEEGTLSSDNNGDIATDPSERQSIK